MKIRTDYVTNSSSSSFIIGKKDDESVTIESVYQLIRGLYKDLITNRDNLLAYIKDHPELKLTYGVDKYGLTCFHFEEKLSLEKREGIKKQVLRDFGVDLGDYYNDDFEWVNTCETYKDYENYWQEKMSNGTWKDHGPFTIYDFLERKEVKWCHFKLNEDSEYFREEDKYSDVSSTSDVLGWYYEYAEELFDNVPCEKCPHKSWCDKEECKEEKEFIKVNEVPKEKACLYMLGRVCISSECGYIRDSIVDKLIDICEYGCNHMG